MDGNDGGATRAEAPLGNPTIGNLDDGVIDRLEAQPKSDRVDSVDAIALQDDRAMVGVEAAAIRLVTDRDKVTELVEAWEAGRRDSGSVMDDIHPAPDGRASRRSAICQLYLP